MAFECAPVLTPAKALRGQDRPNIIWMIVEDMSADFGCYGETTIQTPNLDRLAAEGLRFDQAFVTGPICSICRSALVTGRWQTSIGAQNHRSGRGAVKIHLPEPVVPVPRLFQEAGYLTLNLNVAEFLRPTDEARRKPAVKTAKTDYNFEWNPDIYDKTHWSVRPAGQPFFAQIQLRGGKYRGHGNADKWPAKVRGDLGSTTPASAVTLPPYLPDDPVIREDWAQYLDTVRYTDWELGRILDRLREADELKRTWVFFLTDHGISHVRNKQFLYEGGIRVPLVVAGPGLKAGAVRRDLALQIDLAPTSLALAGLPVPEWIQGKNLFAEDYQPREFVIAARDRADETVDHMRCVRTDRYKYIRNYLPQRPYLQPNNYKDNKPIVQAMRRLHTEGKLNREQALIMADTRPSEELYDLRADPFELHNLAGDPAREPLLRRMRERLAHWEATNPDLGREPESEAQYDSDMAVYLKGRGGAKGDSPTARNIRLMKQWASEGK